MILNTDIVIGATETDVLVKHPLENIFKLVEFSEA
jgi:hypothetical protein